jgi:hypothetical protein
VSTRRAPQHAPRALIAAFAVAVLLVAGCVDAAGGPAPTASAGQPSPSNPPVPGDPGGVVGGPPAPVPVDPGAGQPTLLIPRPGQQDPHPVATQALAASVDGRHVRVKVTWYSGIEPCSVLDSVKVERDGRTIALTVIEGTSDPNAICAELAMLKATIVDLGELEPGSWTITAPNSDAVPIRLTIT